MEKGVYSGLARLFWVALFLAAAIALAGGGYKYYQYETERIRQEKYREIAAIGKLKAEQIEQWRQERLSDISRSSKAPFFGRAIREWLQDLNNTALQAKIQERLVSDQKEQGYTDVLLLDTEGNILLSAEPHPHPLIPAAKKAIEQALTNRTPMLSDLYRCATGIVHVDAVGPILDAGGRPLAVLVLRSNAESLLYPLIQSWPTPSRTAETLLIRRDGEDVLFLNDLRHRPDSALSLREPLTRDDLPAVQAVLGKKGIFQGKDYRGVEVLAALSHIAGSPWFMVAKVDASEILAEARYRGGILALFAALCIVLAAGLTAYGYRYRQVRLYRDLYRSEREQRAALSEFRTTLYSIGDAVITADTGGLVKQMNPVAERLTGWHEADAQGRPISEVFRIINEETHTAVEDPVARVLREGLIVGLANHTLLISRDGSECPIADSGAPICDENGAITGVVLVFQDQTENRRRLGERETRLALLQLLNEQNDTQEMIKSVTAFLQKRSGCEAVGVRLKEGDDFPYFETRGFTQEFVQAESSLCGRDASGGILRDSGGNPVLECMCGNVLSGRFNPALPFFTAKGSFWSNCTTELLASTTEEDRQGRTRNRCNGAGYESVALFRMRSGNETIGLLQLNDRATGRFTPELLEFMESTADEIAIALAQRQAQARLRESEERYRLLVDLAPDAIVVSQDGRIIYVNRAAMQLLGETDPDQIVGTYPIEWVHPDDRDLVAHRMQVLLASETLVPQSVWRLLRRDGTVRDVEAVSGSLRSGESMIIHAMLRDTTDRKRAEEAIQESEERYRSLFDNMLEGYAYCKMLFRRGEAQDFIYLDVNQAFETLTGLKNVVGKKVSEVIPGLRESNQELLDVYGRVAKTGNPEKLETYIEPLGVWFSVSVYSTERDHFVAVFDNITERKNAEELHLQAEYRYRRLFEDAPLMYVITRNEQGVPFVSDCNESFLSSVGYSREEILGRPLTDFYSPESRAELLERGGYARALAGEFFIGERQLLTRDGRLIPTLLHTATEVDTSGKVVGTRAMFVDIPERKRAEEALSKQAAFMTHLMEAIPVPVFFKDVNHTYVGCNNAFAQFVGLPREWIVGQHVFDVVSQETAEIFRQHDETLFGNPGAQVYATSVKRSDGSTRDVIFHKATYGDSDGSVSGLIGVILDITERRILEQQLFQAQKMEAVGTLAGGVAHDFNNLLQVVLGYSELILADGDLLAQYREDLTKVNQAARNGADLVQRLLTFSRKTEVKPRPLNLNKRIVQLDKMLSRTIPKMIEIKLILANELAAINADPTQMEQVLMNLALNARDAMPEGGKLTIQTQNVILDVDYCKDHLEAKPGRYVMLSVSDTGQGMGKNTVQHIFEPFFTTKGPGEGTGLGLAMVYGIVKQHGGHIMCYSEPGQGTIFKMYFPALLSGGETRETETRAFPPGGSETILLVDDEQMIRDLCSRILTKSGYNVITASNGKEALELYRERREKISLVVLDLMMPEMGGKQCLEGLMTLDPAVKVVIASGYSGKETAEESLTSGAKGFIDKPYDVRQVLEVVRAVLDDEIRP